MRVQHVGSHELATATKQGAYWMVVFDNCPMDDFKYSIMDYARWFRPIPEVHEAKYTLELDADGKVAGIANDDRDNVNSPAHYTNGHVETIYAIENVLGPEGFKAYCMGNYMKYMARHRKKNGEEDLKKAEVYLGWAANGLPAPVNGKVPK